MRPGIFAILALIIALVSYLCWHLWRITPHGWTLARWVDMINAEKPDLVLNLR